jgi:hypothetical protein
LATNNFFPSEVKAKLSALAPALTLLIKFPFTSKKTMLLGFVLPFESITAMAIIPFLLLATEVKSIP